MLDRNAIIEILRMIEDPELHINIVDLGLIYQIDLQTLPQDQYQYAVCIQITLTRPDCPMGDVILMEIRQQLEVIPELKDITLELVWEPPWTQNFISEEGKLLLGLL